MKLQFFLYVIILGLILNLLANMIWKYIPVTDLYVDKIVTAILISACILLIIFYNEPDKNNFPISQQSSEHQSPNIIARGNVTINYGDSLIEPSEIALKLRVHRARFVGSPKEHYFINATNLSRNLAIEITHIWYEDEKYHIPISHPSRTLPVRLDTNQSWETFIEIRRLPENHRHNPYNYFRARLSTGDIFKSEKNLSVPRYGSVPGGPIDR